MAKMSVKKENHKLDIAPSRQERVTVGQIILAIILIAFTLFAYF